jgi:hypothetical protein
VAAKRRTAYGTAYRRNRTALLATKPACHRCGSPATTADHHPPLVQHTHVEGSGCCELRPSCGPCNYGDGARLGNARRHDRVRRGAGWSATMEPRRWT